MVLVLWVSHGYPLQELSQIPLLSRGNQGLHFLMKKQDVFFHLPGSDPLEEWEAGLISTGSNP